MKKRVF